MRAKNMIMAGLGALTIQGCDRVPGTPEYRARSALAEYLIDPGSAKIELLSATPDAVCGTVNAKNRMGGYVGRQLFIVAESYPSLSIFGDPPSISDYRAWASSSGPDQMEAFNKLEDECAFPARWAQICVKDNSRDIPLDKEFCALWEKKDHAALRSAARY